MLIKVVSFSEDSKSPVSSLARIPGTISVFGCSSLSIAQSGCHRGRFRPAFLPAFCNRAPEQAPCKRTSMRHKSGKRNLAFTRRFSAPSLRLQLLYEQRLSKAALSWRQQGVHGELGPRPPPPWSVLCIQQPLQMKGPIASKCINCYFFMALIIGLP